ncbi:MAG: Trigger factor [Anaerolineales bacterium]|nr:Trigger factor [Anaerolineales bacterium]
MKVTTQELGPREIELVIEVDDNRMDRAMRSVAREYARQTNIQGFRRGKAPFAVVAQRVGRERLVESALEKIGPQIYEEAIEEAGIEPYDFKSLDVANYDPLTLSATIPLVPSVELGDYAGVQLEVPAVEVNEEDIEEILREYQDENAQLVPVERAAELGDQVIADLKIKVSGEPVYDRRNISFVLSSDGLTGVPEGFFEKIAGMEADQTQEFSLVYPADFGDEDLAGAIGVFTVVLHEVKARELPELDDELAQTVGDFETLEELRERTREVLLARAQTEADNELAESVMQQLMDTATVQYPAQALEDEIDRVMADLEARLKDRGLTLENLLLMEGLTERQLRVEQRPKAEERIRRGAILSEVVKREGLEVSEAEIDGEIETIAEMYSAQAAQVRTSLSSEESRRSLRSRLLAEKAIDHLIEMATGAADEAGDAGAVNGESGESEASDVTVVG